MNVFSNFFSSILEKFDFVCIDICKKYVTDFFVNTPSLAKFMTHSVKFDFGTISEVTILHHLDTMNSKSAPGSVEIEAKLFKECSNELLAVITNLFNYCLDSNAIPDEWKISHITPVFKGKGKKSSLDNYRPISIISPIAKVFESILGAKMRKYFENNNIFHQYQFGFREGRSCHLALNAMIDYCNCYLDKKIM